MKKIRFISSVLFILLASIWIQRGGISIVKASPDIHHGDLVLTGNNVTILENLRFDINGSIIIEENATLILKDAVLNFTQLESRQFEMILQNPLKGSPRLIIENSTITSNHQIHVKSYANSSIISDELYSDTNVRYYAYDSSSIFLSHSDLYTLDGYDTSVVETTNSSFSYLIGEHDSNVIASNCTLEVASGRDNVNFTVIDSTITADVISYAFSINCSIRELQSGFVSHWNFGLNSSVIVAPGGWMPNITLTNSEVNRWSFILGGDSNATISNCKLQRLRADDSAVISVYNSTHRGWIAGKGFSHCYLYDTSIDMLEAHHNATLWLMNSTYNSHRLYDSGRIYVNWHLDVHIVDQIGQDIPSANVTATYPNATQAALELTDADGWTRFTLLEKMMNTTGEYPIGNYTIEATYKMWSNGTTVNMTNSQMIDLTFSDFIIPEFPSIVILSTLITAITLAAIIFRRKYFMTPA